MTISESITRKARKENGVIRCVASSVLFLTKARVQIQYLRRVNLCKNIPPALHLVKNKSATVNIIGNVLIKIKLS